ncbi:hypothetical protein HCC61_16450 [Streptomyces sp. HNM0575]|nr:hypothetical protein [Streptomyces sp. HNM0575]
MLPANGDPWTPEQQREVAHTHRQPAAGQPWGQPWGPDSQAAMTNGIGAAAPPLPPPPDQPLPPEQPQAPGLPPQQQAAQQYPSQPHSSQQFPPAGYGEEAAAPAGGRHGAAPAPPPVPPSAEMPLPPVQPPSSEGGGLPPVQAPQGAQAYYGGTQPSAQQQPPQPPQHEPHQPHQPHQLPPQQPPGAQQFAQGADAPPMSSDATQYMPPITGAPPVHGQYQPGGQAPPVAPVGDADATQMLPPQTGQAPVHDPESTAQLRTPLPPESSAGGHGGQNGQNGVGGQPHQQPQPPAGFESLFRSEPGSGPGAPNGASGEPGSTQSLPIFDRAAARQRSGGVGGLGTAPGQPGPGGPAGGPPGAPGASGPYGPYGQGGQPGEMLPQGRAARRNAERSAMSRMSPGILIGIGVALVAGVGMVAGAAMSGDNEKDAKPKSKSSAAAADQRAGNADAVRAQAKELDKLLDDSNNSRAAVIRSVESIKRCKKLGQAAHDLRAAAGQRNSLVARLGKLETDKIPAQDKLKSSLTRAWKASASADDHYAAWADQTAGKKGCRKGKARPTAHVGLGARASGEATAAKKQAEALWNPTAKKYGLKQRQVGQL